MRLKVAVVYNQPEASRYSAAGEDKAIAGVLEEVESVAGALEDLGHTFVRVPLSPPVTDARAELSRLTADVVFNLFEGFDGRPETEAEVAHIIAGLNVPYTGCPPDALELALDKGRLKDRLAAAGVRTAAYQVLRPDTIAQFKLRLPCIVKPLNEDASHGLSEKSVVSDLARLTAQVTAVAQRFGGRALVEEFLDGREFNIIVMGNDDPVTLPVSEIVYTIPAGLPRILTFASKWETDSVYYRNTEAHCPADITASLRKEIEESAKAAFRLTGCRGYARVDMRLDRSGAVNVLEVNPNPDISPTSGAARQVRAADMTYADFIRQVIALARERSQA